MHIDHTGIGEMVERILGPDKSTITTARAILDLDFPPDDKDQMRQLLAKAEAGTLTAEEEIAINKYEHLGHMLSLMKSKARRGSQAR